MQFPPWSLLWAPQLAGSYKFIFTLERLAIHSFIKKSTLFSNSYMAATGAGYIVVNKTNGIIIFQLFKDIS